jgi:membrane protease YdiL (CAAX protease family)
LRRVNPLAKLSLYLAAVVLLAALLSPPVYWALHGLHPALNDVPFRRFFSRTALVVALALLWPTLRWMNVRSAAELGLVPNPRLTRDLAAGLLLAVLPLVVLAVCYFEFDVYRLRKEIAWGHLFGFFCTAAAVSLVEEVLFRGVLLGLCVRSFGRMAGVLLVSAVFSAVHFIESHAEVADVKWSSGFELLGGAFSNADGTALTASGALALFVIGLVLAAATLRTRSLWLPIGLHAGWIFGQQTINLLGKFRVKPPDALLPWVGPNVVHGMVPTGLAPLAALLVTGALVWWYLGRAPSAHGELSPADGRDPG